jgi:outer membrane receptor protein involved in Fe transport
MTLDQDFTPRNMFTLQQMQLEHSLTEDIVIRNAENDRRWQWLCGLFGFAKWLDMSSPVRFKTDGINDLILANANKGIASGGLDGEIEFGEDNFVIASDFRIPTYGVALYHQSSWRLGRWQLSAGLRVDWEMSSMRYNSHATVPFRFTLTMADFKSLTTEFKGSERQHFFEVMPKFSAEYRFDSRNSVYATITRGYKSGGFNTQIFSDILQVKMMNGMMESLGIYMDDMATTTYDSASATRYKPETSWNFEVGTHLAPVEGLTLSGALFWIECFDQQVTVLPKGMSTGRMMSNAARARSFGVELSAEYRYRGLSLVGDYGYTNARFRDYDDGVENYAGNYLPYAPQNTVSLVAGYSWLVDNRVLNEVSLSVDWRAIGRIYWNEANTLSQPLYSLLGAQLQLRMGRYTLSLWGCNLTNTRYDVFYFKSVGEEFFSWGKPLQCGVRLNINL